jgi:hypothetical protein
MSKISERTLILGTVRLSGKRDRYTVFPWEIVSADGVVWGWEPAELLPMGGVAKTSEVGIKPFDVLPSNFEMMEYDSPFFYDEENGISQKTLLHGGHVQIV